MNRILATLLACFLMQVAFAQDKLPAFGKIDKLDLGMKVCDFDLDADAMCLIDLGEVKYNLDGNAAYVQADFRCRIKILKEKGISQGDIKIHYTSINRYEEITNVAAFTYNLDDAGNIITTKLEKAQIYDKPVNKNYSEISFAMPNVKVGTVIEYRYRSYKRTIENIPDWYFQRSIPVRYSGYNLLVPEYFDFTYQAIRRQDLQIIPSKETNDGVWYTMRNIPSLQEEPMTAGIENYYQRVNFQLSAIRPPGRDVINLRSTWLRLTEELINEDQEFGGQLKKNVSGIDDLKLRLKTIKSKREKIYAIYQYVQHHMEWNGRHSIYSDNIKDAWDKKRGSSADINLLLVNLLKDADVTAYPLLASTKDNGRVTTTYPFLKQFNEVLAYAVGDNESDIYILDATDKYNPYTLMPYDIQMTEGWVVDLKKGGWVNMAKPNQKLKHNIAFHIEVEPDGKLKGEALVTSIEYGRNVRLNTYNKGKIKEVFETTEGIRIAMDSIHVNNLDNDTLPFEQTVNFSGALQSSGEYPFLSYNLFTGLGKNPFVSDKRQTDIDLNYPQSFTIQGAYTLPDNFEFEELPKNMRMIMPDTSITLSRIFQKSDQILNFRIVLEFKRSIYAADEYADLKAFYKQLFAVLNEKIVVKKKA